MFKRLRIDETVLFIAVFLWGKMIGVLIVIMLLGTLLVKTSACDVIALDNLLIFKSRQYFVKPLT